VGIEDRVRKLERRLQPQPAPPSVSVETRRAIDGFVEAMKRHGEEWSAEGKRRELLYGESSKEALTAAKVTVLERHDDGIVALDAVCAAYQPLRQRREELRKERG
jgi:hypothetical protein